MEGRLVFTRRRQLAWLLATLATPLPEAARARDASGPGGSEAAQRDAALRLMRAADTTPSWFTSANWDNRNYQPWTDYLVGRIDDEEFGRVCAAPSDYCLRDVWNLRRERPARVDWAANVPFNWSGIHALALRFFRTGDDLYLRKWLAVVGDFADWSLGDSGRSGHPLERGVPAALLDAALAWGGIFTAWAICAKALRPAPAQGASPYAPAAREAAAAEFQRVPAADALRIVDGFARGQGAWLARHYAKPIYVPNQRMFGLEALACAAAFFPGVEGVGAWRSTLHEALADMATRYRLPDGGQLEQSFNYAQGQIEACERVAKLPFDPAPDWRSEAEATANGWWRLAGALAAPDGTLPQLGNAAWGRFGRQARPPRFEATSLAFPYSGLYAMRSAWTTDSPYLFFFHRRAARGHSMAGTNSVQVAAFGRQLLSAGGSALYGGPAAGRRDVVAYLSETSSWKTCTVLVDGRSQAEGTLEGLATAADGRPDVTRAPTQALRALWHASDDFDLAEAEHREGYRGTIGDATASLVADVSHLRRVVFVRSLQWWVIVDVLRTTGTHEYNQVWKLSPPANGMKVPGFTADQVELRPRERVIETVDGGAGAVNLRLQHFGMLDLSYSRHFGTGAFGWFASGPMVAPVPACDVHVQWRGGGPQVLVTLLVPFRGREVPVESAQDGSSPGRASAAIVGRNGARLSIRAQSDVGDLALGRLRERAEVAVLLEQPGSPERGLVVGGGSGFRFSGDKRTRIEAPAGLRWLAGPGGGLIPTYEAAR